MKEDGAETANSTDCLPQRFMGRRCGVSGGPSSPFDVREALRKEKEKDRKAALLPAEGEWSLDMETKWVSQPKQFVSLWDQLLKEGQGLAKRTCHSHREMRSQ